MPKPRETSPIKRRLLNPWHPKHRYIGNVTKMLTELENQSPGVASWFLDQIPENMTIAEFTRSIIIDLYDENSDHIKEQILVRHNNTKCSPSP